MGGLLGPLGSLLPAEVGYIRRAKFAVKDIFFPSRSLQGVPRF